MTTAYEASPEKLAGLMTAHIEKILQGEIAALMNQHMKPIIEEASKTMARNLRGTIHGMRNIHDEQIVFILKIDGVDSAIDAAKEG